MAEHRFTLDAGCGYKERQKGDINIDIDKEKEPDIVAATTCLPFRDSIFDTIFCIHVLEHLNEDWWLRKYEITEAVIEFRRVVKSQGVVIIETPSPQSGDAVRQSHKTVYSHTRLATIFRRHFNEVHVIGINTWIHIPRLTTLFRLIARFVPFFGETYRFILTHPKRH